MATITSIKSGSWSDAATWNSGTVPEAADNVTIAPGHTVFMDTDAVWTGVVTVAGVLSFADGVACTIGSGTTATGLIGTLRIAAGGEIGGGTGTIYTKAGFVYADGTPDNWAKLSGGVLFNISPTPGLTRYHLAYLSVTTQGGVQRFQGTYNQYRPGITAVGKLGFFADHCVFDGPTGISVYTTSATLETDYVVTNCDFRNLSTIYFTCGASLTAGKEYGRREFTGNTCVNDAAMGDLRVDVAVAEGQLWDYTGTVFINVRNYTLTKPTWYKDVFSSQTLVAEDQTLYNTAQGTICEDSYIYSAPDGIIHTNPHIVTAQTFLGGVVECESDSEPNICFSSHPAKMEGLLALGYGDLCNRVGNLLQDWDIRNCTRVSPTGSSINGIWLSENGVATPENTGIVIRNCLHACLDSASPDLGMCRTNSASYVQTLDSDYNCKHNVTVFYRSNIHNTNSAEHDFTADPQFVDPTRGFVSWTRAVTGNPAATYADGFAYLSNRNGYEPASKTQNAAAASAQTTTDLVQWVREGFVPQNTALETAGENGAYVGAMPVGGESPVPAPAPVIIAPGLITGSSGATGIWSVDFGDGTGTVTWVDPGGTERQLGYTASLADWTVTVTASGTITAARTGGESTLTGSITLTAKNTEGKTASKTVSVRLRGTVPPPAPGNETGPLTFSYLSFG